MKQAPRDASLGYHAARLLLLIRYAGSPQRNFIKLPGIRGRTLLAKLDFFIRYPVYLDRAVKIRAPYLRSPVSAVPVGPEGISVESQMVRYLYGPWDREYFNVLGYLIGKRLIAAELERGVETFRLTHRGIEAVHSLVANSDYQILAERASVVASVFPRFGGTALKDFIYSHFPDVVSRKLGAKI